MSFSESIEELFSCQVWNRGSFYHNWDMWFLFLNIDKDVKARFALSLSLNRQLQKLNKIKKSNCTVGLKKITDYRIFEGTECRSGLCFKVHNHVDSAVMFQFFGQLHVPVCATYVSYECPLTDWSTIFHKKSWIRRDFHCIKFCAMLMPANFLLTLAMRFLVIDFQYISLPPKIWM